VSLEDAQTMIMTARVMLGWVDPAELETAEEDVDADATEEAEA
jgi:N utilization substance protein A